MSFISDKNYTTFDKGIKPYNLFSSFVAPTYESVVPTIKKANGEELKSYWQPEAINNNKLINNSGIKTNAEYRKYMTQKANIIRDHNHRNAFK